MSVPRTRPNRLRPLGDGIGTCAASFEDKTDGETDSDKSGTKVPNGNHSAENPATVKSFGYLSDADQIAFWLRRADQFLLGFLLIALLVLLIAFRWKLSGGGRGEIEIISQQPREYYYVLDVNKASWVEWAQLDGIGEKLGRRIVKDREDRGPFNSIDDIRRVRGIGPKMIEKLRPYLKCARNPASDSIKELR